VLNCVLSVLAQVTLSLPRAGPRHGPNTLTVFASSMFFARALAAAAGEAGAPAPGFACALTHARSGARVVLAARLNDDGTALTCVTAQPAPLLAGEHDVAVSFNGVEFGKCVSHFVCERA
jgi:hypothetical protein